MLRDRICQSCNNVLGALDEQYARSGPEGFLRRHYGVQGRSSHRHVNPFYRGNSGAKRIELVAHDNLVGLPLLMECEDGDYAPLRQLIFIDGGGAAHHVVIREDSTAQSLRGAYEALGIEPLEVHVSCPPEDWQWVIDLLREAWPKVTVDHTGQSAEVYEGAVAKFTLSDRYFRCVAKTAFHYFLTQFPELSGRESEFETIREFIWTDRPVAAANEFISKRNGPLLVEMLTAGARPKGWRGHVLAAEIKSGRAMAHIQMFLSEDWPAPIYTVQLGSLSEATDRAAGHVYVYYLEGRRGKYCGEAYDLSATTLPIKFPAPSPAILHE